ncbi:Intraflagellar transport protein 46 like protein [Tupaia chinensis]|uniref:Intraflagellar transport protein 46 homolog n=1 Tax=Tupaia chinensis TaxID=246437 RepID=L9KKE3_TUPCH|nr:Intraflagellar transport protein 46 like protein [Tupaia chinensis]
MADNSSDEYEEENSKEKKKTSQLTPQRGFSEDDDDDSSETDSDEDDDEEEHGAPLEGAYDPADYEHLPVSAEIKELFQYISRYTPQLIDLDHKLKPFIPDFIPAVGDIDAFLKVPRPDGKPDNLGLLVLDEPSTKQSDPTVLSLWLTENSKQHNVTQHMKVKSLEDAEKNPKAIDTWIESISELHRSKPPATVHYTRPMPDIDTLMQEWSPEFEELLGKVSLPTAEIDCSLAEYVDMICAILDIPVYKSRIQSLHLLFSLYSEFKNSQISTVRKMPKLTRRPCKVMKLMETKLPWIGPSLTVKMASGVMVEAEEVLEAKVEEEEAEVNLVAEANEALEGTNYTSFGIATKYHLDPTVSFSVKVNNSSLIGVDYTQTPSLM